MATGGKENTRFLFDLKVLVPLLIVTLSSWFLIVSYLSYRRLSHIPGPRLAHWSCLWLVGAIWRKKSHLEFYDLHKQYGQLNANFIILIRTFANATF